MSLLDVFRICAVLLIVVGPGCVSDEANRYYSTERFPPKNEADVELLATAPDRPYEVIADFQARGASPSYMRRQAAKIGADAIIVGMFGGLRAKSDKWAGQDSQNESYTRISGSAIRYKR